MNFNFSNTYRHLFYWLLGVALFAFLVTRAIVIPMTVDETHTVLIQIAKDVHEIVTFEKDAYTNNHIFNTLCIKFLVFITGMNTNLLVRLPNLLVFVIGYYFGIKLLRQVANEHFLLVVLGMVLLFCNPYYLDFCALARGYGMNVNFAIASVFFSYNYLLDKQLRNLIWGLVFAILCVYSNFSAEHFFFALGLYLFVFILLNKEIENKIKPLAILIGAGLLLGLLMLFPVLGIMRENGLRFFGIAGFYDDTILTLIRSSLYGKGYIGTDTLSFFTKLYFIFYGIATVTIGWLLVRRRTLLFKEAFFFFFCLLSFTALSCLLQNKLLHVAYLTTRTGLIFIPLSALMLFGLFHFIQQQLGWRWVQIPAFVLTVFWGHHLIKYHNFRYAYEWWFDADTYNVLDILKKEYDLRSDKQKIYLGTFRNFQPSFYYYQETQHKDWMHFIPWDGTTQADGRYEYMYIDQSELPLLQEKYDILKAFNGKERYLMIRKDRWGTRKSF